MLLKISTRSWGRVGGQAESLAADCQIRQPIWPFSMANGLQRKKKKYPPSQERDRGQANKNGREGERREREMGGERDRHIAKETWQAHNTTSKESFFFFKQQQTKTNFAGPGVPDGEAPSCCRDDSFLRCSLLA